MIEDLDLHDATLIAVHVLWAEGTCTMTVRYSRLSECTLAFAGVSNMTLPRTQPWGRSQSINSATERKKGQYEIEMQSGDLITIEASEFSLSLPKTGGEG